MANNTKTVWQCLSPPQLCVLQCLLLSRAFSSLRLVDHIESYILEVAIIEDNAGGSEWNSPPFSMNNNS